MSQAYLYGADITGIQSFIFATGKLKEIIGASELIARWSCLEFSKCIGDSYDKERQILGAAGRIRYLFPDKESCGALVKKFGRELRSKVPQLRLSEAVVPLSNDFSEDVKKLNQRLRTSSNRYPQQHGLGWMISERSRRTALPAAKIERENQVKRYSDRIEVWKDHYFRQAQTPIEGYESLTEKIRITSRDKFPKDLGDITGRKVDQWIAIVHADGNNMGQRIQQVLTALKDHPTPWKVWKAYSKKIDDATKAATKNALAELLKKHPDIGSDPDNPDLPLRPVIMGGDDLTLIIRGDLALDFTHAYLRHFAEKTEAYFKILQKEYALPQLGGKLTACAGVSYIKYNFPFHYGAHLAEELTKYTKRKSKDYAKKKALDYIPTALAFHRVQSSFVDKYDTIIEQQLTVQDNNDQALYFNYGPYFLDQLQDSRHTTIDQLKKWVAVAQHPNSPAGSVRDWLTNLHQNPAQAAQQLERIQQVQQLSRDELNLQTAIQTYNNRRYTHLFEVLSLADIKKVKPPIVADA